MTDTTEKTTDANTPDTAKAAPAPKSDKKFAGKGRGPKGKRRGRNDRQRPKKEFDEVLLEVRKVTKVNTGGRQMSFRATILVGNRKGKIGVGSAKGPDVATAIRKATREAYKAVVHCPITENGSIPYQREFKFKACRVRLIPASQGTGLKAGSAIRLVLDLAGYTNILSKMIGSTNKLNNALTTIKVLSTFK